MYGHVSPVSDPIVFNETRINPGGHYDNTTSIYTTPVSGIYEFNIFLKGQPDPDFGVFLVSEGIDEAHAKSEGSVGYMSAGFSVTVHATIGRQFWVRRRGVKTCGSAAIFFMQTNF